MREVTLRLNRVSKTYANGVRAVREISLEVAPGTIFGLIGPNGAGKSTLLRIAAGLIKPDAKKEQDAKEEHGVFCDELQVTGDPEKAARYIGLMPDPLGVYTDINAIEYLRFFAGVLEIPSAERQTRIDEVIHTLELGPWLDSEVESLSAGWQRRLALARVLLAKSAVLLLDEPAAGLDISAREELLAIVKSLARKKHSIIVSSHILPELEQLADSFGILSKGEWVEVGPGKVSFTRSDLATGSQGPVWELRCKNPDGALPLLEALGVPSRKSADDPVGTSLFIRPSDEEQAAAVLSELCRSGVTVYEYHAVTAELNDFVRRVFKDQQLIAGKEEAQ